MSNDKNYGHAEQIAAVEIVKKLVLSVICTLTYEDMLGLRVNSRCDLVK